MISVCGSFQEKDLNVITMSRGEIQNQTIITANHVVISICSPCETLSSINTGSLDVLRLRFQDLDASESNQDVLFSKSEAERVVSFLRLWIEKVDMIIIHCGAGVSRSVGLAAALTKVIFGNDDEFFKKGVPNRLVYRIALETFMGSFLNESSNS